MLPNEVIQEFCNLSSSLLDSNPTYIIPILQKNNITATKEFVSNTSNFNPKNKSLIATLNNINFQLNHLKTYLRNLQIYINSYTNITIQELQRKIHEYTVTINNLKNLNHLNKETITKLNKETESSYNQNQINVFSINQKKNSEIIANLEAKLLSFQKLLNQT